MTSLTAGLEPWALLMILSIMAVAGYLHTVSGFGLGMIVMGAAGGLGVASVPVLAAVVSLVTLVNSAVALPGASQGGLIAEVWGLAFWSMPVVGFATWFGRRYPPPCSAGVMRWVAMLTLIGLGVVILLEGVLALLTR